MFTRNLAAIAAIVAGCATAEPETLGYGTNAVEVGPALIGQHYTALDETQPACALGWFKSLKFVGTQTFSGITRTCWVPVGTVPPGGGLDSVLEQGVEGTYQIEPINEGIDFLITLRFHFGEIQQRYRSSFGKLGDPAEGLLTMLVLDDEGLPPPGTEPESATNLLASQ